MKLKTLVMLGLTALPLSAVADTVVLTGFTYEPATTVSVSAPDYSGLAGQFTGTIDGNAFTTWCTEIGQSINFGNSYEYSVVDGATAWGAAQADLLGKLLTVLYGSGLPNDALTSAAIQTLIWEIIYEDPANGYNTATGNFVVSDIGGTGPFGSGDIGAALANVVSIYEVDQLYNREYQNLLIIRQVPEPATLALMGLGLLGMGLRARRRTR